MACGVIKENKMINEKITANIGFEKKIWDAACVLRGNMDASEYKSVVLGLIFLKYISDRFDEKMTRLTSELSQMFVKSHELEEAIKKNLAEIGWKI